MFSLGGSQCSPGPSGSSEFGSRYQLRPAVPQVLLRDVYRRWGGPLVQQPLSGTEGLEMDGMNGTDNRIVPLGGFRWFQY